MPVAGHDPLRPARLADFTGQPEVVRELSIILGAAKARREVPPHLLLAGPPGLGKTTLANIVATEAQLPLITTSGPLLEKSGDLVSLLANLNTPSVVFVDEIHRIPKTVEETLYTAMEDSRIDIVIGEGRTSRVLTVQLEPFTLVGATTRSGDLGEPFRDRFGHIAKLRPYDEDTLAAIVARSAGLLGNTITEDAAHMIASRSRGTPRVANKHLRRVRDFLDSTRADHPGHDTGSAADLASQHPATAENTNPTIDSGLTAQALETFGIDPLGLTAADRELLLVLCRDFAGGPVGVETLATAAGEAAATVAEVNEPYLMKSGLLARTPRGRVATAAAYRHLGLEPPVGLALTGEAAPAQRRVELTAPEHSDFAADPDTGQTLPGM